jgi:dolichol-phosphate mannosyltransferase
MKRVLLTGGTGFVGANLLRRLLDEGCEVHLLLRPSYSGWRLEQVRDRLRLHVLDLLDAAAVEALVDQIRPQWIFHLAAHGAYSWQTDLRQIIDTNLIATMQLVEACRRVGFEAFVNTGSSSEYGFKDHAPREDEGLEPNSYYAVGKAAATMFCRYTAQRYDLHLPTLRLYNIYGPWEERGRFVPALVTRGLEGKLPPLVSAEVARDLVFVDDCVDAYLMAARRNNVSRGSVYNVGTGQQTTIGEAVDVARRVMNIAEEPVWGSMDNRHWDTTVWIADSKKIRAELGWEPKHTFEQGLRRTVEWYRATPSAANYYAETTLKA